MLVKTRGPLCSLLGLLRLAILVLLQRRHDLTVLVDTRWVDAVDPALVQED